MLWKKERKEEKKNEGKGRKDVKVGRKRRRKCEGRKKSEGNGKEGRMANETTTGRRKERR